MSVSIYQNGALTPVAGELYKNDPVYLLDFVHPKGTYFWTDDQTFDPNTEWGGTWERIEDSFIYAIKSTENADGVIKGSKTHTLTESEIPSHRHNLNGYNAQAYGGNHRHSYTRLNLPVGVAYQGGQGAMSSNDTYFTEYSGNLTMSLSGYTQYSGSGNAFDIMPPYIGAYCWHRTA